MGMRFIIIGTEGGVSEGAHIDALKDSLVRQVPTSRAVGLEVVPLGLGGNHGHVHLVENANVAVDALMADENHVLSCIGDEDDAEKWLVCDYDSLNTHGVDEEALRNEANAAGFTLIINKPNFEFYVLGLLKGFDHAKTIKPSQYEHEINQAIDELNRVNVEEKGFGQASRIPPYSKKRHIAPKLFSQLATLHPELLDNVLVETAAIDYRETSYSEMPVLVRHLVDAYTG